VLRQLLDRGVEAESGLHTDREEVERVRHRGPDLVAPCACLEGHDDVGEHEAEEREDDREDDRERSAHDPADDDTADDAADCGGGLRGEKRGRRDHAPEAGAHEACADRVHRHPRVHLEDGVGEAHLHRIDDASAEGLLGPAAGRPARLAVVGGAANRAMAFAGRQGGCLADQVDGGAESCDCEEKDEDHGS
jgi:hypothetical protein